MDKVTILLNFPKDEVRNSILDCDILDNSKYNLSSIISEQEYEETFGTFKYPFTGINMIEFYRDLVKNEKCNVEFVLANDPKKS